MTRRVAAIYLLIFFFSAIAGQDYIMPRDDIMKEVKEGLASTYNYQFTKARKNLAYMQQEVPDHPATLLLESLIIYWENYPMTLENPNTGNFISLIENTFKKAEKMLSGDPDNLEGIFFDLFGKAFYAMFWADNGKPGKVFPYLNMLYKQTVKGFDLQSTFNEFCFTTGLYNYYIVSYPEKNPVYKPVALLFRKGDKEYGINQLKYCASNSVFLRVEAKFYLALIYFKYENNYKKASEYASELYREFPNNTVFTSLYAEILMMDNKFAIAGAIIRNLERSKHPFAELNSHILKGYYLEKYEKNYTEALGKYRKGLEMSQQYGEMTKYETARAYMGISRHYSRNQNSAEAARNFRSARNLTNYEYILNDK